MPDTVKKEIIPTIIDAIQDKKGRSIVNIDLSRMHGASTQAFVICTGNTPTQVSAIADNVEDRLIRECRRKPAHEDGRRNATWIVLDYGEVMVHIFVPDERTRYNLEELWGDAPIQEIPDLD